MIRLATTADIGAMVDVYNQAIADEVYANCDVPQVGNQTFELAYFFGSDRYVVLVNEASEGRIVGWGALKKFSARPHDADIAEVAVYIARDNRSVGLGIHLLKDLIAHAEKVGFRSLMAVIVGKNNQSIRGSKLCGFEEKIRFPAIARLYGGEEDIVWMQKLLT